MPYIPKRRRAELISVLSESHYSPITPGELNFLVSHIVAGYLKRKGNSYSTFNDILGALEGAKLEFYRRVAVPYENGKLSENGDVYDAS